METNAIGKIEQSEGEYVVGCVVCREKKPVMLYPHRLDGAIVGWVFVCADDAEVVKGADVQITCERWPVRLGPNPHA